MSSGSIRNFSQNTWGYSEGHDRMSSLAKPPLEAGWQDVLGAQFNEPYMRALRQFLREQKDRRKVIYPSSQLWFNAFRLTPFDQVKVVILGQDPYHGPGQAHGLCFSVLPETPWPPSLVNIFQEIRQDLDIPEPSHGCLQRWAEQGVLLLNATLTVERHRAGSHQGKGWEQFTDRAVQALDQSREGLVFMLWGSHAQRKGQFVDSRRHLVLKAPHPSPLSAHRGFFGCRHFSRANQWLKEQGQVPIDWSIQ